MLFYALGRDEVLDEYTPVQAELLLAVVRDEEDLRLRALAVAIHSPDTVFKAKRPTMPGVEKKKPNPAKGLAELATLMNPKQGVEIARKINLKAKAFELAKGKNGKR